MKAYLKEHKSERLTFRLLTQDKQKDWGKFLEDPRSNKFFPPEAQTADYVPKWFERQFWRYENGKLGFLGIYISETDEFIGQCGLLIQDLDGTDVLEVGYHLLPKHWGNGYASEASQFFKKFAFDHDLTEKLYSMIHVDNIASQKVALRNGMTNEAETIVWNLPVYLYTINKSTYDSTL